MDITARNKKSRLHPKLLSHDVGTDAVSTHTIDTCSAIKAFGILVPFSLNVQKKGDVILKSAGGGGFVTDKLLKLFRKNLIVMNILIK